MGKDATPKCKAQTAQTGDIHERIQAEAKQAQESHAFMPYDADETPALAALLTDAFKAVIKTLPTQFEMEGRTYWVLRSKLNIRLWLLTVNVRKRHLTGVLD